LIRRASADNATAPSRSAMIHSNVDTTIPETDVSGATS
jgi:hypothetical protein